MSAAAGRRSIRRAAPRRGWLAVNPAGRPSSRPLGLRARAENGQSDTGNLVRLTGLGGAMLSG